jgi:hypothetical protein
MRATNMCGDITPGGLIRAFEVLGLQQRSRHHLVVTLYYVAVQVNQQCTAILQCGCPVVLPLYVMREGCEPCSNCRARWRCLQRSTQRCCSCIYMLTVQGVYFCWLPGGRNPTSWPHTIQSSEPNSRWPNTRRVRHHQQCPRVAAALNTTAAAPPACRTQACTATAGAFLYAP